MKRSFSYPIHVGLGLAVLPIAFAIFFSYIVALAYIKRDILDAIWESLLLALVFYIAPSLVFTIVTIKLNDEGVSTYWCGIRTQKYAWKEVKRIVKTSSIKNISPPNEFIEIITENEKPYNIIPNLFGSIKINELLNEYIALKVDLVRAAKSHNIPLFYVDEQLAKSKKTPKERREWMRFGVPADSL